MPLVKSLVSPKNLQSTIGSSSSSINNNEFEEEEEEEDETEGERDYQRIKAYNERIRVQHHEERERKRQRYGEQQPPLSNTNGSAKNTATTEGEPSAVTNGFRSLLATAAIGILMPAGLSALRSALSQLGGIVGGHSAGDPHSSVAPINAGEELPAGSDLFGGKSIFR
jgi:hypothetical protein